MKRELSDLVNLFSLVIVLALISPVYVNAQGSKVNFAGDWTLNTEKSTMPEGGGYQRRGGGNFVITQEANLLTRTRTAQDGTARTSKYTLDGMESVNTPGRGESKSIAQWSADGKSLTIKTTFNFNGNERKSTEVWSLKNPKTLSITVTRKDQNGVDIKYTLIYEKK